jgi:hypothetical protein
MVASEGKERSGESRRGFQERRLKKPSLKGFVCVTTGILAIVDTLPRVDWTREDEVGISARISRWLVSMAMVRNLVWEEATNDERSTPDVKSFSLLRTD